MKTRQKLLGIKHTAERSKNKSEAQKIKFAPEILQSIIDDMKIPYSTQSMIMKKYSLSGRVYRRLKKENVPYKKVYMFPVYLTFEEIEKISLYTLSGLSYKEVADLLNRTYKTTRTLIKKLQALDKSKFVFINRLSKVNRKETWPEKMVRTWLEESNISFLQECQLERDSKWYFDFKITDVPLVIEVHGDYWHRNPLLYSGPPTTDWHKYSIKRDYAKRDYAVQMGYRKITIWENSIKTKPRETKDRLIRTIEK